MSHSSNSPKAIAALFTRIGFGLALAFTGFAHYQDASYPESVGRGLQAGFLNLEPLGEIWGYILPGLMIVGGLLLAFGIYMQIAAYLSAIALASIPAGLMLKSAVSGIPLDDTMPPAMNAFVWLLVLMVAVKATKNQGCCCGMDCAGCDCCAVPAKPMAAAPAPKPVVKSIPTPPVATMKATPAPMPAKKPAAPAKKAAPKKK